MQDHIDADETCLITAEKVFNLTKQAREIFLRSFENRSLLWPNFVIAKFGVPKGIRTPVSRMKTLCPDQARRWGRVISNFAERLYPLPNVALAKAG